MTDPALQVQHRSWILGALLLGTLMTSLSLLVVTTALPLVIAALGGMELYSWVFAASMLTSTLIVPIAGKMSDLYGRKLVYMIGMTLFLVGSAACGMAQTIEQLIAFRALQGLGAGGVAPAVSALIADLFPPEQRGRWQGVNGAIWGFSSVVGPLLGGYLAEHVGWQSVFFINLPAGLIAALIMARCLPWTRVVGSSVRIDFLGMALLPASLLPFLLITVMAGRWFPWASGQTAALFLLSVACLAAFIRHEQHAEEPIMPMALFGNVTFQTVVILVFITGGGLFGAITYVPLYLQAVFGLSATATGLLFLPTVVGMMATSVAAGLFMHRIGYRRMTICTMAAGAIGFGLLSAVGPGAGTLPIVVGLSIIGGGIGVSFPVFIVVAQNCVPRASVGVATSTVQLMRSLGGTVGVALMGAALVASLAEHLAPGSGRQEISALLRPESVAALGAGEAEYLRSQLADAIRTLFVAGTAALTLATAVSFRLDPSLDVPLPRFGARRRVTDPSAPGR